MRPKKHILIVDDNEQALSVRQFVLQIHYRCTAAMSAQEALAWLETRAPGTVHLLIADLLLPGMDGNELVRRAKQMHPEMPALIVSGTVADYTRGLAADAFLPKGAGSTAELLDKVKTLVARKRGPKKRVPYPVGSPLARTAGAA